MDSFFTREVMQTNSVAQQNINNINNNNNQSKKNVEQ